MKAALRVLNELEAEGCLGRYAIGGAMGALFYAEPVTTYDLDIFLVLPESGSGPLTLDPLYEALRRRGYEPGEYVVIEGVPVQFLPAYNPLLEEALALARPEALEGVPTRILTVLGDICKRHGLTPPSLDNGEADEGEALWTPPKI